MFQMLRRYVLKLGFERIAESNMACIFACMAPAGSSLGAFREAMEKKAEDLPILETLDEKRFPARFGTICGVLRKLA